MAKKMSFSSCSSLRTFQFVKKYSDVAALVNLRNIQKKKQRRQKILKESFLSQRLRGKEMAGCPATPIIARVQLCRRVAEGSHERHEQSWGSGLPQERMMKQLEGGGSLSRVSHQHSIQKAL